MNLTANGAFSGTEFYPTHRHVLCTTSGFTADSMSSGRSSEREASTPHTCTLPRAFRNIREPSLLQPRTAFKVPRYADHNGVRLRHLMRSLTFDKDAAHDHASTQRFKNTIDFISIFYVHDDDLSFFLVENQHLCLCLPCASYVHRKHASWGLGTRCEAISKPRLPRCVEPNVREVCLDPLVLVVNVLHNRERLQERVVWQAERVVGRFG